MAARTRARLSGRSAAVSVVFAAIMPQPMSTPTAAGITAFNVGITLPTVEPLPTCTSGITAMCLKMNGIFAVISQLRARLVFHGHAARPHLDVRAALDVHGLVYVFVFTHVHSPIHSFLHYRGRQVGR